jgi:Rad3-related DNA helicase
LLTPLHLGLPPKFTSFYPGQLDTILTIESSPTPSTVLNAPTGSGKSVICASLAFLHPGRTLYLVGNKSLQSQIAGDLSPMGPRVCNINGHSAYGCASPGDDGEMECSGDCQYRPIVLQALDAQLVITNPHHWITIAKSDDPNRLGHFDLLIIDEAHTLHNIVCDQMAIDLSFVLAESMGLLYPGMHKPSKAPRSYVRLGKQEGLIDTSLVTWRGFIADPLLPHITHHLRELQATPDDLISRTKQRQIRRFQRLSRDLTRFLQSSAVHPWAVQETSEGARLSPAWARDFIEPYVYRGIERSLLCSATIFPGDLPYLGLSPTTTTYLEIPSTFPAERRPVYYLQTRSTPRLSRKTTEGEWGLWQSQLDSLLQSRPVVKGVIHSVSFDRAREIVAGSRHKGRLITHEPHNRQEVIRRFIDSPDPLILVSPSVTEGFDFPGDMCRLVIIAKLPFEFGGDPLTQLRATLDKTYSTLELSRKIVQGAGRGMRSDRDWCEVFILDGQWGWFRREGYFPGYFMSAVRTVGQIPPPLTLED